MRNIINFIISLSLAWLLTGILTSNMAIYGLLPLNEFAAVISIIILLIIFYMSWSIFNQVASKFKNNR